MRQHRVTALTAALAMLAASDSPVVHQVLNARPKPSVRDWSHDPERLAAAIAKRERRARKRASDKSSDE